MTGSDRTTDLDLGLYRILRVCLSGAVDGRRRVLEEHPCHQQRVPRHTPVERSDSKRLFLATQFQGVWSSRDGGDRWEAWNEGLTNLYAATNGNNVTNTMALSADGRMLYFGSTGSGVFRRTLVTA